VSEETVDEALAVLMAPRGGPAAQATRDAALGVLLSDPGIAHPKLLALAQGTHPPPLLLLALAEFGRPESIEVLTRALCEGDAPTQVTAAEALARHPLRATALPGLQRALDSAREPATRTRIDDAIVQLSSDSC
jgi:hypothetical protein